MVTKMVANRSFRNAAVYSRSKRRVEPRCSIGLHRIGDVRIQVHGRSDGGMPQTLLSDFRMHSIGQELKIFFAAPSGQQRSRNPHG